FLKGTFALLKRRIRERPHVDVTLALSGLHAFANSPPERYARVREWLSLWVFDAGGSRSRSIRTLRIRIARTSRHGKNAMPGHDVDRFAVLLPSPTTASRGDDQVLRALPAGTVPRRHRVRRRVWKRLLGVT